jgi:hypothetical protein
MADLATVEIEAGRRGEAVRLICEAAIHYDRLGSDRFVCFEISRAAVLAAEAGEHEMATRLLGYCDTPSRPQPETLRAGLAEAVRVAGYGAIGRKAFWAAYQDGSNLSLPLITEQLHGEIDWHRADLRPPSASSSPAV